MKRLGIKNLKEVFSLQFLCLLAGCVVQPGAVSVSEDVSKEHKFYQSKCALCHALPHPKRHYAQDWPFIVDLMQSHSAERNLPTLTLQEKQRILDYLQPRARD